MKAVLWAATRGGARQSRGYRHGTDHGRLKGI